MGIHFSMLRLLHLLFAFAALAAGGMLYLYSGDADLLFLASPILVLSAVISALHWFDGRQQPAKQ